MNKWHNQDDEKAKEEVSNLTQQLKLEIRLFQGFLEEKQDELADLGERQDSTFMENIQDFSEKGNESIRCIRIMIEKLKNSHKEKSELQSFKKLEREFNDLFEVFESQCDPETLGFDVEKYYENKINSNKKDPNFISPDNYSDTNVDQLSRQNSGNFF